MAEWNVLLAAVGDSCGTKLNTTSGWDSDEIGIDVYGFSILPAGFISGKGFSMDVGSYAHFWTSTDGENFWARNIHFFSGGKNGGSTTETKDYAASVRCVKD